MVYIYFCLHSMYSCTYYMLIQLFSWVNDTDNWLYDEEEMPTLCGNLTGARHCPLGYMCICVGDNPNHGYTNFDNFMWSMLTTFQLITLDYWENVYNMVKQLQLHSYSYNLTSTIYF